MNKHGQSIIEYVLITVLVILGIVYMGPYVLRSVNGHFKLWDEGMRDSYTENITQAPLSDVPFINASCTCGESLGGCGASPCGADSKPDIHSCTPEGCDFAPSISCTHDVSCCTVYYPVACGTMGGVAPAGTPVGSTYTGSSAPDGTPFSSSCVTYSGTSTNCYLGQYTFASPCSGYPVACCHDTHC